MLRLAGILYIIGSISANFVIGNFTSFLVAMGSFPIVLLLLFVKRNKNPKKVTSNYPTIKKTPVSAQESE